MKKINQILALGILSLAAACTAPIQAWELEIDCAGTEFDGVLLADSALVSEPEAFIQLDEDLPISKADDVKYSGSELMFEFVLVVDAGAGGIDTVDGEVEFTIDGDELEGELEFSDGTDCKVDGEKT